MGTSEKKSLSVDEISENLVTFAIDREDLKIIMGQIPPDAETNRVCVEYELQLLKILSVGWSISFYMGESPHKEELAEKFWFAINEFSLNLAEISATAAATNIDYFGQVRERLDLYIDVLNKSVDVENPASVIGPAFARCCGDENDPFASISGAKIFNLSVGGVREYLNAVEIQ